jgi:Holliday junction DNA helicase RuvA
MIGRLRGKLIAKRAPHLLVDVAEIGDEVVLHTHLVVREDAHLLFGFGSEAERAFFRELIKISGVGAKMGLAILSGMSFDDFARCVRDNDVASLVRLPGVGKKTAERLIVEMRDKLEAKEESQLPPMKHPAEPVAHDPVSDAVSALVALGYKPNDASRMVRGVKCDGLASEEIIRQALKAAAG